MNNIQLAHGLYHRLPFHRFYSDEQNICLKQFVPSVAETQNLQVILNHDWTTQSLISLIQINYLDNDDTQFQICNVPPNVTLYSSSLFPP